MPPSATYSNAMAANTLQLQILRLIGGALLVVSLAIILAVWFSTGSHVRAQINNDLNVGRSILLQLLDTRQQQLLNSAEVLTADFGFKQAVASKDSATIQSALTNHGERIQADLMSIVSLQGKIVASTNDALKADTNFPEPDLVKATLNRGGATEFLPLNGDIYQIILLPVKAPIPLAVAVIGFRLNHALAQELKQITHLDVTFAAEGSGVDHIRISTLDSSELQNALQAGNLHPELRLPFYSLNHYATLAFPLSRHHHIQVYLSSSVDAAFSRFDVLQLEILLIALIAIALSLAGGVLFARRLTRPLQELSDLASDIATGHYRREVRVDRNVREIDNLSRAFNTMQEDLGEREARIIYQAHHDPLTGLINRQHAVSLLNDMMQQADTPQLLIVVMNILDFRTVNDTFGHLVGDLCLTSVSERLNDLCEPQALAARLAGDEFLFITPVGESPEPAIARLLQTLQRPYAVQNLDISLKFVVGVAQYPRDANGASALIQKASIALDMARREKIDVAHYERSVEETHLKRLKLLADLKTALLQDDGQLRMYYQPKIGARDLTANRFEALIRWIHPEQGFIPPDLFIPLAEQAGLINSVTDWVVGAVIRQISQWQTQSFQAQVAVNLSAQDLSRSHLLEYINQLLKQHQVAPHSVSFEITESELMSDPNQAIALLNNFRNQGFHLAIDDFGTGYSSLSQLKNMPVTELKIDRSFVMQLDNLEDDQIIVRSTINLAHSFNLEIVAEGVENEASLQLLRQWGIDWVQGYFFSRPLPAPDVLPWIQEFTANAQKSAQN